MHKAALMTLERRLSAERLAPYRTACGGDLDLAVLLYEWNSDVSAAFWGTIGHLEIVVRNAMHELLTVWSTDQWGEPRWYDDPSHLLSDRGRQDVAEARRRATARGRAETPGRVIAELPLGFWRYLLSGRYERTLWLQCLRQAWPGLDGQGLRRDAHNVLRDLHVLRNRIAHHEPIHNRPLREHHAAAITAAGWICPVAASWMAGLSSIPQVLERRPGSS